MSRKTEVSSAVAATAMFLTFLGATDSGASAQELNPGPVEAAVPADTPLFPDLTRTDVSNADKVAFVSRDVIQPLTGAARDGAETSIPAGAASLDELVSVLPRPGALSREMECLAGAIYFEARGEPLSGQLAVGRVIVDRTESRRFPTSYCGVVYQPAQFSFVRGGRMPPINQASRAWQEARAIAVIADRDLWESPAKGALFFHAAHVKPGWKLQRVAQINTHVFYR
jgi:N-acetylmuramoyl-L-alanine amidase